MNKETEWFGEVRWCDNDLKNALIEAGYFATENNVAEIRTRCGSHRFVDQMIDAGWDYIYNAIFDAYSDGRLEYYELQARPLSQEERLYISLQSQQISMQTGFIGYLKSDFGSSENSRFSPKWEEFNHRLNTDEFVKDRDYIIEEVLSKKDKPPFDKDALSHFCIKECQIDNEHFGMRIDSKKYTYIFCFIPDDNNLKDSACATCFCYYREWFDNHLEASKKGIRFIDPEYNDLFVISDGGKIKITFDNGESVIRQCRYIDQYHFEVDVSKIYHICEFAERMQENGNTVEPAAKNE